MAVRRRVSATQQRHVRVLVGDSDDLGSRVMIPAGFTNDPIRWPAEPNAATGDSTLDIPDVDWLHIVAQSIGWLRRFIDHADLSFTARRVTIVVDSWKRPLPGWSGQVGAVPGIIRFEVRMPTRGSGRTTVDLTVVEPLPVQAIVVGALDALMPRHPMPSVMSADALAGDPIPRQRQPSEVESTPSVLLDITATNPIGRRRVDHTSAARVRFETRGTHRWWRLDRADDAAPVATGRLDLLPLDEAQLAAVSSVGVVCWAPDRSGDPAHEAALLVQLASSGVVIHPDGLPQSFDELLSPELSKVIRSPLPEPLSDPIEWELRSVQQRRAALRGHAVGFQSRLPTVSALLVTMRPDDLPKVVETIAAQTYPELEIVIGLHGCRTTPAAERVLASCGRPVEVLDVPSTMTLGEGLGVVTARARGDLVTKVDDDDMYGAEHIWDLVLARQFSGAEVVGKGAAFVYLEALGVTVRRGSMDSETYSTVVAGGTILMSRGDLAAVGGWRPVPRGVDEALFDRVLRAGGLIYRTHPMGFVYRRHLKGHTWDPGLEYFLRKSGPQWSGLPPFAEFVGGGR